MITFRLVTTHTLSVFQSSLSSILCQFGHKKNKSHSAVTPPRDGVTWDGPLPLVTPLPHVHRISYLWVYSLCVQYFLKQEHHQHHYACHVETQHKHNSTAINSTMNININKQTNRCTSNGSICRIGLLGRFRLILNFSNINMINTFISIITTQQYFSACNNIQMFTFVVNKLTIT